MTARLLDGSALAQAVRNDLLTLAERDRAQFGRAAGLAIVRVGDDPASAVYTQAIERAAQRIGVVTREVTLPATTSDAELRHQLEALNADDTIQGVITQLPLPPHLAQRTIAETIDPSKDVDGISMRSAGNLYLRRPSFVPSTCAAVMELLDRSAIPLSGMRAVVVGASNVVGKPLAFLLLDRDATVTVCHIYTRDLASWTRQADVLIAAAGKAGLITAAMVKPGATVIDVGINVDASGAITGDVDFAGVSQVAGALSPVPGGVGPLTRLMLLKQTLQARTLWSGEEP